MKEGEILLKIEEAMQEEEAYLYMRDDGIDVSLPKALEEFGYTLESYFVEKREYQLKHSNVKIVDTTSVQCRQEIENAINSRISSVIISNSEEDYVWKGSDQLDLELCKQLGLEVVNLEYEGGNIVTGKEDVNVAIILPDNIDTTNKLFLKRTCDFIGLTNPTAILDSNDILIDGKKVVGAMFKNTNHMKVFAMSVSLSDHSKEIAQICKPNPVKLPSYINNITYQEFKDEILSWLQ